MTASKILSKLYQGSAPQPGPWLAESGIKLLVLCAEEYQPERKRFPDVEILRCPFDDSPEALSSASRQLVFTTARQVAKAVKGGQRVLVTCFLGLNRSGLVTGLAMAEITGCSGDEAVRWIRSKREGALSNSHFVWLLRQVPSRLGTPAPSSNLIVGS